MEKQVQNTNESAQPSLERGRNEAMEKRMEAIGIRINSLAQIGGKTVEQAQGKLKAVIELAATIQPEQDDILGKVCLLERGMGLYRDFPKPVAFDIKFTEKYLEVDQAVRRFAGGVRKQLDIAWGFADRDVVGGLMVKLKNLDPKAPNATTQLQEIADSIKYQPETPPASTASAKEMPALQAKELSYISRTGALATRLQQLATLDNILTDEAKATLVVAIEYLNSTKSADGSQIDSNIGGKIELLESAFNVHPKKYNYTSNVK